MIKKVKKIWGQELWISNRKKYCGKKLILKRDYRCSLHYHKIKEEDFYINRGVVLMEKCGKKWVMRKGDSVHILPKQVHRFTGLTDAEIIEFSTHHRDSDSYRKELSGKAKLRKAYDYDGVITIGIKPDSGAPIITSRSWEEVNKVKIKNHPIYFNPITYSNKNLFSAARWKSEMIKKLKIDIFYDDDPETIVLLRKLCPNVYIVKI